MKIMKKGEVVLRLTAYKTLKCRECEGFIYAGQNFLLDIIPYTNVSGLYRRVNKVKRAIHEHHWRGPRNIIVDRTRRSLYNRKVGFG